MANSHTPLVIAGKHSGNRVTVSSSLKQTHARLASLAANKNH